jgi:hypothetical protein
VFAEDALVNDIRREFRGRPAIRRWLEREADGRVTLLIITHNSPAPAWSRS